MQRSIFAALAVAAVAPSPLHAHFLFARILPPAEAGRAVEVYFSELAEAGDPRFIDKVAPTELWMQATPGKFEALKPQPMHDRLRAHLPVQGSVMVVGRLDYGVLGRAKQTPFLLRHFPKAVSGRPEELNRLTPHGKLPLEIAATFDGAAVHLTALKDGKPLAGAEFITVDRTLNNEKFSASGDGKASWKPPASGPYAIYIRATRPEAGAHAGKKYEEIRDFATLAFDWPLERTGPDPAAVALFEEAVAARAQWRGFRGFRADIAGNLDGRPFAGSITVSSSGQVEYLDNDASRTDAAAGWVEEQIGSIVLHRRPRASDQQTKPVLRFGDLVEDHPLGRLLLFEGGKFASSYRVKDRQIMVVNRHLGKLNMTITVLENDKNVEGRFLPRSYTVHYWDAATGRLMRTETVQTRWQRVSGLDLPATHLVTATGDAGVSVRGFTLSKHELSKPGSSK